MPRPLAAIALFAALELSVAPARADPPSPATTPGTGTTHITWRILENRGPPATAFSARFEVLARAPHAPPRRLGPFVLPCYLSTDDGVLTCVHGGAFDYLRLRRVGGTCLVEAQPSTEHGPGPRRRLAAFPCRGRIEEHLPAPAAHLSAPR